MKLTRLTYLMALAAMLTIAGAGCRKSTLNATNIPGTGRPPGGGNMTMSDAQSPYSRNPALSQPNNNIGSTPITMTPTGYPQGPGHEGWMVAPGDPLGSQTIHFDYDKSAIKASETSKLEAVGSYLKSHPNVAVRVEGNCDERGTEEYNRSLGERRSLAAREHLAQMGIDPARVDTITYGEDKPVDSGHTEAAFAKNRRDDFVVLLPPQAN